MKNLLKLKYMLLMPLMASIIIVSCSDDDEDNPNPDTGVAATGKLNVRFENPVELGTTYVTAMGDSFQVNSLKYYISNIKLYNADGLAYTDEDSYYLIEKTDGMTREMISLGDIPVDTYTKLEYSIGVDADANDTLSDGKGELSLDAQNGMFWAWKTGYKFLRMDGKYYSPDSTAYLDYRLHSGLNKYYLEKEQSLSLEVTDGGQHMIHFMVMTHKLFDIPNQLDIKARSGNWQFSDGISDYDLMNENIDNMLMIHHSE